MRVRCSRKILRELTVWEEKIGLVFTALFQPDSMLKVQMKRFCRPAVASQVVKETQRQNWRGEKSQHKDRTCTAPGKAQRLKEALEE